MSSDWSHEKKQLCTSKFKLFTFIIKTCHWPAHPHLPLFICLSGRREEVTARGDKEKNKPGCFLQTTHWPLSRRDMRVHTSWNCLQSAGVGAGQAAASQSKQGTSRKAWTENLSAPEVERPERLPVGLLCLSKFSCLPSPYEHMPRPQELQVAMLPGPLRISHGERQIASDTWKKIPVLIACTSQKFHRSWAHRGKIRCDSRFVISEPSWQCC